ncbi:MAG: hypothetical protein R3E68_01155 [Burkholderiaceae bacterium]
MASRFVQRFGEPMAMPAALGLTHCFPTPAAIAAQDPNEIAALGIIGKRARTIQQLAQAIASGALELAPGAPVPPALRALTSIAGIGDWTAQYIAMRALRWPDAFPAADLGVMKGLGVKTAAQATRASQDWRPWRAYAVMHLWERLGATAPAVESNPTKE